MHPPPGICRALYRLHPQLRLAWAGRERKFANELNPGSFAIVQLYHSRDSGDIGDPITFREYWDVETVINRLGQPERVRVDRGPIFNKNGDPKRDWRPYERYPIFVATLDSDYQDINGKPLSTDKVLSGEFLKTIERWLIPIQKRAYDSAVEKGKQVKAQAQDIAGQIASNLWFEAKKHTSTRQPLAKKHAKESRGRLDDYYEGRRARLEDAFLPPMVKGMK